MKPGDRVRWFAFRAGASRAHKVIEGIVVRVRRQKTTVRLANGALRSVYPENLQPCRQ
jgi:hypothetical protein